MGGRGYDRDVGHSSSSGGFSSGTTSSAAAKSAMGRYRRDDSTDPLNRTVTSKAESPLVIALDGTGSNIEFANIFYDKSPLLYGQIEQQGYLKDFDICFAVIGDAYCDSAPLQVADFAKGIALDDELKKLWLESGGGGQLTESYELAAHYFSRYCNMPKAKHPFFFMIGDEAPYPYLEDSIARRVIGKAIGDSIDTKAVFAEMFKKFNGNAFYLQNKYCGSSANSSQTEHIRKQWVNYFGPTNAQKVIQIHDDEEKSVVDIILGLIATTSRQRDLDGYKADMLSRGQTKTRIASVTKSIAPYASTLLPVAGIDLSLSEEGKKRGSGGKKL